MPMIKGKILIVDDEEGMRVTLKKILSNRGYSVTTAADFQEANYYLQKMAFDTVVADIILSDINGLELLRVIKETSPNLPTIMITGVPNIQTAIESVRLGAYDYLIKPITKDNLPPIIAKAIEKKRLIEDKDLLKKENLDFRQNFESKVLKRTSELEKSNILLKKFENELLHCSQCATVRVLVSFINHKLQNHFKVIHNSLQELKHHSKDKNPRSINHIQIIEKEIDTSQKIINDLPATEHNTILNLQKINLTILLDNTFKLLHIPENILIKKHIPEILPLITADEVQITQILTNLFTNAVQAMPNGGELTITAKKQKYYVEISFLDTGTGILKKDHNKIFQPFFTTRSQQNGLGLPICKFLLELHGGTISFQSTQGKGSTFSIQLPLEK